MASVDVVTPSVRPWRLQAGAAAAVLALSVASTALLLDGVREGSGLSVWDGPTLRWMVAHREPGATTVLTFISALGTGVVYWTLALLAVVVFAVWRRSIEALLLAVALVSAESVSRIMKQVVNRARPPAALVLGPVETNLSFPSGHTIGAAAFSLALAYLWWRARRGPFRAWLGLGIALVLTVSMAISRLYLGYHWLTDTLASTALAFGVMAIVALVDIFLQQRFQHGIAHPLSEDPS
jgi:membrane-associated phospholipid phosphatase